MSTPKKVIKTTQKTEPAAAKKGTKPAAPKTDGKKNGTPAKETATPPPAPDTKAVEKLKEENKALHRDRTTLQIAKADFEEKYETAKADLNNALEDLQKAKAKATGYINRGNEWVYAAIPTLILGVWLFFMYQHNNQLEKTVQDKNAVIERWKSDYQKLQDEKHFDSTHKTNDGIKRPDVSIIEKKSPVSSIRLTV